MSFFSKVKSFFSEQSEVDKRVDLFKSVAQKNNYVFNGFFKESGKLSFRNEEILIIVSLLSGDVVTTKGTRKLKRIGLSDEEIIEVIKDPRVKINKEFQWI